MIYLVHEYLCLSYVDRFLLAVDFVVQSRQQLPLSHVTYVFWFFFTQETPKWQKLHTVSLILFGI